MSTPKQFATEDEIRRVVKRFESFQFKPDEFKHHHHLTVALWYLGTLDSKAAAIDRMRVQLKLFTSHYQVNAYHETITIFWMEVANAFKEQHLLSMPLPESVNRLIATYPSSKAILNYYSQELLDSENSRKTFVEPDLKRLSEIRDSIQAASSQINSSS